MSHNSAVLSSDPDVVTSGVIAEKTACWQNDTLPVRHLSDAGVRPGGVFLPVFRRFLSLIPTSSKVLDVGCGRGRLSVLMAEAGHQVVATDVRAKMLELLQREKGSRAIEIRQSEAHRLGAEDGEFDAVISYDFMPRSPDWPRLLREKARACREGGLVIFDFNFIEHRKFAEPFGGDNYTHPGSPSVGSSNPFGAECSVDDMLAAAHEAGLKVLQLIPATTLTDNIALGGALGDDGYNDFKNALQNQLDANPAVAEFYAWLEAQAFQRLPFFTAYTSLVVLKRNNSGIASPTPNPESNAKTLAATRKVRTEAERNQFFSEIPSETSLAERQLLFELFRQKWEGSGSVVEIGPFLGGTTRAIASGMMENPQLAPTGRLVTFDRFSAYYDPLRLRDMISPLVPRVLTERKADELCQSGNFLKIFEAVHCGHDYYERVSPLTSALPEFPEEIESSTALDALAEDNDLSALFIDGCKSWASTRYAMEFLLPRTRVGAPVIFQDFGWYTCFWISAFVFSFKDFLEFRGSADSTYVFYLKTRVTAADIATRFAKTPDEMGAEFFWRASTAQLKGSLARGDHRGVLIAQLHLVAALLTIGEKEKAAGVLNKIKPADYGPLAYMIAGCRKSPTYGPGGEPILWT